MFFHFRFPSLHSRLLCLLHHVNLLSTLRPPWNHSTHPRHPIVVSYYFIFFPAWLRAHNVLFDGHFSVAKYDVETIFRTRTDARDPNAKNGYDDGQQMRSSPATHYSQSRPIAAQSENVRSNIDLYTYEIYNPHLSEYYIVHLTLSFLEYLLLRETFGCPEEWTWNFIFVVRDRYRCSK